MDSSILAKREKDYALNVGDPPDLSLYYQLQTEEKEMRTYLKVKIKTLAAEARIIRQEERRWPGQSDVRTGLHLHRTGVVRSEARHSLLAYGFLRGRRYRQLEARPGRAPDWERVWKIIQRFHTEPAPERWEKRFKEWTEEAIPNE